ncbi:hypothetical protein AYO49_00180 [Verrucomicrobiaceae bacterium SCGC AG-212-N21]|nr:hypothetical protein AYO49_00180 [Verrucomicrobiaceae bacterium SCGC AG-212-N21]
MKRLPSLILLLVATASLQAQPAELREFSNTQGIKIKARLVSSTNGQVTIVREDGRQFTLPLASLSAADQEFIKKSAPPAGAAVAGMSAVPLKAGPNDKLPPDKVNEVLGLPLFGDAALWASPAADVASKLGLKRESETKVQSSFRSYPKDEAKLFGAHPYSIALYADEGKVTSISMVFANKGDLFSSKGSAEMHFDKNTPPEEAAKLLATAMKKDIDAVTATLKGTLGEPQKQRFGDGEARRNVFRWDWRGHSILLSETEGEYVGVQIETAAFADSGGKMKRTPEDIVRARVKANVETRPGGDVVINDLPMVDQGPKGYCVPATAERAMRYLDVPADMYVLAMAGNTGFGGGTSVSTLLEGVGRDIKRKGRTFDSWRGELKIKEIARHIDKGVPIIWGIYSTKEFNATANKRTSERKTVSDWAAWKAKVTAEAATNSLPPDTEKGHVVLIMGYNKETNEIAFSDSWGERYKERWITIPEGEKISQQSFYVVGF